MARLNRDKFANLRTRQLQARQVLLQIQQELSANPMNMDFKEKEREARDHYVHVVSSVIELIKQQSKAEWIGYGDYCTKLFFSRAKQRKMETYVYELQEEHGHTQKGFKELAWILHNFYQKLLGSNISTRAPIDPQVIQMGTALTLDQQI